MSASHTFTENERNHYTARFTEKAKFTSPEAEFEWANTQTKCCTKCFNDKPLTLFSGNTSGSDPFDREGYRLRRPECIDCTKKVAEGQNIAKKIAKEQNIPYRAPEGTTCAVCHKLPTVRNGLVFDHCHDTNTFRGYLCNSCNRSIGVLGDTVESLLAAINYLNKDKKLSITQNTNGILEIIPTTSSNEL